jgi:hypothetical protein
MRVLTVLLSLLAAVANASTDSVPRQQQAREILAQLVAFDTSRGRRQVPVMAKYLAGLLQEAGFA